MRSINDAIEWIYGLHVGVVGQGPDRHEKPHKPVLLLAVLDLIASGQATPDRILWSQVLRDRFTAYLEIVRTPLDNNTPENPFRRLRTDRHWNAVDFVDGRAIPLTRDPLVGDCDTGKITTALTDGLERFVLSAADRLTLRHHIISRYFPARKALLEPLFQEGILGTRAAEEPDSDYEARPGRNSAFRKKILEIYDCQCAACGLRIRLPEVRDLTFVDAAHLIPYSEQPNDHPTNGLALCKNHHWAMDRFLIAPGPDGHWKVSPRIIPHRSPGEKDLADLAGNPVLPPNESAFAPAKDALAWRCERLAV
jgi:putative restriction endonuclease